MGILIVGLVVSIWWSPHIGIGATAFAYFLISLHLERQHLDRLIVPPLVLLGFNHLLSCGLGLPLYWYGVAYRYDGYGLINRPILDTQICHAIAFPVLMFGYWLARRGAPSFDVPPLDPDRPSRFYRLLNQVGWLLLLDYAVVFVAGWVTGGTDRSLESEFLVQGPTTWSLFNTLPRLQLMYFMFLPLMYRLARSRGRMILLVANGFLFTTFLISGSRGMLLTPVCLILIGAWMFWRVSRRVTGSLQLLALLVVPYVPLIALYRSTDAFMNSSETNIVGRLDAFSAIKQGLQVWDLDGLIQLTGESFYGLQDELIFARTPAEIPYAGWDNIGRLKLFWLPTQLAPAKKPLLDGNEIVARYMNDPDIHGSGISFSADMYRRFGWKGIIAGNFALGLFLGGFFRWVFRLRLSGHTIWMTLMVLYFLSYFTSTPYHTLLGTCWIWLWEFPKHLIALGFLVLVANSLENAVRALARSAERRVSPAASAS